MAAQSTSPLASEHAEIAARLMAAGPGGVDIALLTAAAKALRDVSVLDKQFLRVREVGTPISSSLHQSKESRHHLLMLASATAESQQRQPVTVSASKGCITVGLASIKHQQPQRPFRPLLAHLMLEGSNYTPA